MEKNTTPLLPMLTPVYRALEPFGYATMRLTSGVIMASFGWGNYLATEWLRTSSSSTNWDFEPAILLGYVTSSLEFFGGLMIAVGLLTRPVAALLLGELLVILIMVMIPRGTGYQLTVVWVGVFLLILLHGGGRISVDRLLVREF